MTKKIDPLVGQELIDKIAASKGLQMSEIMRSCGYTGNTETTDFNAFYAALKKAKGV